MGHARISVPAVEGIARTGVRTEGGVHGIAVGVVRIKQQASISYGAVGAHEIDILSRDVGNSIIDADISEYGIHEVADGVGHLRHHVIAAHYPSVAEAVS